MRRLNIAIVILLQIVIAGCGITKRRIANLQATQAELFVESAMCGNLAAVEALVAIGVDPNTQAEYGGSPRGVWEGPALIAAALGTIGPTCPKPAKRATAK